MEEWFESLEISLNRGDIANLFEGIQTFDVNPYASHLFEQNDGFKKGLGQILNIHWTPRSNPVFGPMMIMNGRRSLDIIDIPRETLDFLEQLANGLVPSPVKARLYDIIWEIDKSRVDCANKGISNLIESIKQLTENELTHSWNSDIVITHRTIDNLYPAASIIRQTGQTDSELHRDLIEVANSIFNIALAENGSVGDLLITCTKHELFENPKTYADIVLEFANKQKSLDLFRARDRLDAVEFVYKKLKLNEEVNNCKITKSNIATEIAKSSNSSMFAAGWISTALDDLNGIPNQKERKKISILSYWKSKNTLWKSLDLLPIKAI